MLIHHSWQNVSTLYSVDPKRAEPERPSSHSLRFRVDYHDFHDDDDDVIRYAFTDLRNSFSDITVCFHVKIAKITDFYVFD